MTRRTMLIVGAAMGMWALSAPAVLGDWYDDFYDHGYWQNQGPNCGFPNGGEYPYPYSPPYNPALYEIDQPHWDFNPCIVGPNLVEPPYLVMKGNAVADTPFHLQVHPGSLGQILLTAWVSDVEPWDAVGDPCTSTTWWDNTTDHYILCKVWNVDALIRGRWNPSDPNQQDPNGIDPNGDQGTATLLLRHSPTDLFYGFAFRLDFDAQLADPDHAHTFHAYIDAFNAWNSITVLGEVWLDPNDPNWADVDTWERSGFWMLFQYRSDPNYDSGDPNGKHLRGAIWHGDKYAWNGVYTLDVGLGNVFPLLDQTYWSLHCCDPGVAGVAAWGVNGPSVVDVAYDHFEVRTGVFTNVPRRLQLTLTGSDCGTVEIDPDLLEGLDDDPNVPDPNDLDEPRRYTDGTKVTLIAKPYSQREFWGWEIGDPNHPGDANYSTRITNTTTRIVMDGNYAVKATFADPRPVAEKASGYTLKETPVTIDLTATDPNGDTLDYLITGLPGHGTLTDPGDSNEIKSGPYVLSARGDKVIYTPADGYAGMDDFMFRANDGTYDSNPAPARIYVRPRVPNYSAIDLGTLFGGSSQGLALSDNGAVAGSSDNRPFRWEKWAISGVIPPNYYGAGEGINPNSHLAGHYGREGTLIRAFLWSPAGGMTDLGTLGGITLAYGINADDKVVGVSSTRGFVFRAFLWSEGVISDLGTLGGSSSEAFGINKADQVVGTAALSSGVFHAFLWNSAGGMTDLGTLGGRESVARAINDADPVQLVGMADTSSTSRAFLWSEGSMTDLGTLDPNHNSDAAAINDLGQVVGRTWNPLTGDQRPFIWDKGVMTNLNSLVDANDGWTLSAASDINEEGQIVGEGSHNGNTRAFLLNPGYVLMLDASVPLAKAYLKIWPNWRYYPVGENVSVQMTAPLHSGGAFQYWEIYDPAHPNDANYASRDSNNPATIVMNGNYKVVARYKCGSGVGPMLAVSAGLVAVYVLSLRRCRQRRA